MIFNKLSRCSSSVAMGILSMLVMPVAQAEYKLEHDRGCHSD